MFIPLSSGEPVAEGSTHNDHMGNQQWMYKRCKNLENPQWTPYSDSRGINLVLVICMPAVRIVVVVVAVVVFPRLREFWEKVKWTINSMLALFFFKSGD